MKHERSSFSGRIGFVLAAAGSAVGLGNIWRFPYLAAKYGGGIFLLVYLILAVTFGFALMITEISLGRKTGLSCIGAYKALNSKFRFLGWLASLVPIIITPYYCVIGGWVIKYFFEFLRGQAAATTSDTYFTNFISVSEGGLLGNPLFWFILFVVFTAGVVLFGVQKGIEKASRIMMPLLVVLSIFVAVFSLTIPGAIEGLKYYLLPDFKDFSTTTVLAAMGQLFYSMSLAMGIMITYGSYMKKEDDLEKSVNQIEIFDTAIAFIAGLMIIPAVFAFSGGADINAGPGLMFVTLPKVFGAMKGGAVIGMAFFLLVLFAALTSSISLMETVVSIFRDRLHWERRMATLVVAVCIILLGLLSCLGYGPLSGIKLLGMEFLDFFDFISNSILMPIVALLTCILVGHVVGTKAISDEVESSGKFKRKKLFQVMIRWIAPICVVVILLGEILKVLGVISI
ncbi:MAG: sodium-dependent transporter [Lachnospiraceae bacterium]|jgi:NSS family neurotransmitter:Na+ symporter|nr:sodium-dependent transporter [Lachnospiraceae bacterium]MCI8994367.1 sodium-dependent transporter [Lachnospiraceae bacterium]MCI9132942.1 sodium-dependent transporter [Lachnospiraceae bacterium]